MKTIRREPEFWEYNLGSCWRESIWFLVQGKDKNQLFQQNLIFRGKKVLFPFAITYNLGIKTEEKKEEISKFLNSMKTFITEPPQAVDEEDFCVYFKELYEAMDFIFDNLELIKKLALDSV